MYVLLSKTSLLYANYYPVYEVENEISVAWKGSQKMFGIA